jgi:hypothetical protein
VTIITGVVCGEEVSAVAVPSMLVIPPVALPQPEPAASSTNFQLEGDAQPKEPEFVKAGPVKAEHKPSPIEYPETGWR